jgi:CO/xanthine dehydrogenase FAD-binding subunit
VLARGADSIGAWRERLRKLVAPAEGYRQRTVPVDTLLKTAADAESPAELRVGAALAIAQSGDEDARRRLRIATEGIANEPVRLALEAAAEADAEDEAIAEACTRAESSARLPEHG